jgi:hypothetical protein
LRILFPGDRETRRLAGAPISDREPRRRVVSRFQQEAGKYMHMVALYTVWYNFVRQHKTLRMAPAMAAGISDRLWSMEDVVALIDAPKPDMAELTVG